MRHSLIFYGASFLLVFLNGNFCTVSAQTILLDDFEAPSIREVNPGDPDPSKRYLWNQYEEGGFSPGTESTSTDAAHRGERSLKITISSGNLDIQFFPYVGAHWRSMREFVQPPDAWQFDTYNRLRFWIKMPPGTTLASQGKYNIYFGTYLRKSDGSLYSAEDGGGHYYHRFNLPYTGEWHQIIIDSHPDHIRNAPGSQEHGDQPYPTGESGYNYFDALTRFYFATEDGGHPLITFQYPATAYIDSFELFRETRPENTTQIYSLNGVYAPASNELFVGWRRRKWEDTIKHEVRYAFEDIHSIGWEAALPAPGGIITPLGGVYNGMTYSTTAIDVTDRNAIYVAVKPQNSSRFRQIVIPISGGASASTPIAPSALNLSR